jgi:hypothetical protein
MGECFHCASRTCKCDPHPETERDVITREELNAAIKAAIIAERERIISVCENAERVYHKAASNRIGDKTPPHRIVERPFVLLASELKKLNDDI